MSEGCASGVERMRFGEVLKVYREPLLCLVTLLVTGFICYGSVIFSAARGLSHPAGVLAVWPINALLLSLVLLFPRKRLCLLSAGFLGMYLGKALVGYIAPMVFLLPFLRITEVFVAAELVERSNIRSPNAPLPHVFTRLLFWACFLVPAFASLLTAELLSAIDHAPFLTTWALRFMSDGLGMLIIMVPLVLINRLEGFPNEFRLGRLLETILVPVTVIALDVMAFRQRMLPLLFTVFPTLIFATFRLHFVGTALMVLITSSLAIYYMQLLNRGPIALALNVESTERLLLLQAFLAAVALTMLSLSVILRHRSELLARRTAELAQAYERERFVANTFQHAALDENLPIIPGLAFDAVYHAAKTNVFVGGDWYDAFRVPDGRIVLSIGDVAGSGLHAAVLMGSVRQSIRTAALINPDPMAILNAADRIVRAMSCKFVTTFVAVIDPLFFELLYSCAGHPPPLLRTPNGAVRRLEQKGLPLGLRQHDEESSLAIKVEPGSVLAFYTDGLIEFNRNIAAGEQRLLEAMSAISEPGRAAHDLYDDVLRGHSPHDDVAILTIFFEREISLLREEVRVFHWEFRANDVDAAYDNRESLLSVLRKAGFGANELATAELVFGELLSNIVRYVGGKVSVYLDMNGEEPVLHVLDQGYGFEYNPRLPKDLMSERGRGLFLISSFAEEVSVVRRRGNGSHARVVLGARK